MAEINLSSLKNAHQIREYEERKSHERRRNLLYLIAQYLKEECYYESALSLSNEAQLSCQYQVCDNVDLGSVLQDFESYYYVRFQRYPKICKRVSSEEGPFISGSRRTSLRSLARKPEPVHDSTPPTKPPPPKTSLKNGQKPNGEVSSLETSQMSVSVSGISAIQPLPPIGDVAEDGKNRKKLKSLYGFKNHTTEWLNMAESITKEIFMENLDVSWDDIKGLEEPKRLLRESVIYPIKYPALFQGVLSPWRGLLLFGPPGTGKTLLAKAVASEGSTTFFNISASTIVSKWRGDSEKLVRVLFDLARYHAPSTIFLDEIEALASCRDTMDHEASRRLKTELLIQLDGLAHSQDQVFLLATSNLPWEVDPAMLRRLEKRILVDLPNAEARELMLKHHLPPTMQTEPPIECDIFYSFLAEATTGYSGSDIRLVCKEAAMQAIRGIFKSLDDESQKENKDSISVPTIKTDDVQVALDKTRPSAAHFGDKYTTWQQQFGSF